MRVEDGGDTYRAAGNAYGVHYSGPKTIVAGFAGLGLKTREEVPRRNGTIVAASRSSCRSEATS